ncbi:hypothetical protein FRB90_002526 [Tulasnella sp. 427]|nr:hypothetical protein FRB90_002526 [Tulasnella sp. 427]
MKKLKSTVTSTSTAKSRNIAPSRSSTAKPATSKAVSKRKTPTPTTTPTRALFTGQEGVVVRRRIDNYLRSSSAGNKVSHPAAYREAVRTKKGNSEEPDIEAETSEDHQPEEEPEATGEVENGDVEEEEGFEREDDEEDGSGGGSEEGGEELVDDEEESEMRTLKGKGKDGIGARAVRFGGVVMLKTPFPVSRKLGKPALPDIKALEEMGLAAFNPEGFAIPASATHEEVDQIIGEILPTPIDHLRTFLDEESDTPVWELLKAEYRNLFRTGVTHPAAEDIRAAWGDGRSIAAKTLFICPTFPFGKNTLSDWESSANPAPEPKAKRVTASRKRKSPEASEDVNNENHEEVNYEHIVKKKRRIASPVDDEPSTSADPPRKKCTRSATANARSEIDLTGESPEGSPLRERQIRDPEPVFLLSSPDKEFDPYSNPSRYFGGL